jgi:hypothetical protein
MAPSVEARGNRAEAVQTERRKKPNAPGVLPGLKLHVPKDQLDPTKEHRWVNDTGTRVQDLYNEDWDVVDNKDKVANEGAGSLSKRVVDGANGMRAVLMSKPKDLYAADKKEKAKVLDEIDAQIRRGQAHERSGEADLRGVTYTPEGHTNSISRG